MLLFALILMFLFFLKKHLCGGISHERCIEISFLEQLPVFLVF